MQDPLLADEPESRCFLGPLLEVHAQPKIEGRMVRTLRIIGQPQHQVGYFPSIIPITRAAGGHHPHRPFRAEHEMHAGKQVHEQIARDARAVVPVVVPPEEPLRIEGPPRSIGHEPLPVDRRSRSIRRNRIAKYQLVAIHRPLPPRLDQVQGCRWRRRGSVPWPCGK